MKPINVSVRVDRPREEVYAFLDVLANHAPFTDHMLVDWSYSGPATGVGAKARLRANLPGPRDWVDMEVVAAEAPVTIVEQAVSAKGRRRTQGTYTLKERPDGGTDVCFEMLYLAAPAGDRLAMPLLRVWLQRGNAKVMRRLGATLAASASHASGEPSPA
jgi:hypothetical protein